MEQFSALYFSMLADIVLIFGMKVNHHEVQIEVEFRCTALIFRGITGLRLSKIFFYVLADTVLIFGMKVNTSVLKGWSNAFSYL